MAKGRRGTAAAVPQKERRSGPSEAKQRRIERQKRQEAANKARRQAGEPLPWDVAETEREKRHNDAIARGSWQPVQRTELGFLVRPRGGGGVRLEDPGSKIRDKILRDRASR